MTKAELQREAQPLCDASFTMVMNNTTDPYMHVACIKRNTEQNKTSCFILMEVCTGSKNQK